MKLSSLFKWNRKSVKWKSVEKTAIKVTPYEVAHDLYCQMIQRPIQEHDEIVYTFLRLYCPEKIYSPQSQKDSSDCSHL